MPGAAGEYQPIGPGSGSGSGGGAGAIPASGRLTLTSATPILTSTVSGATTVYFTPYKGNTIPLWNGSAFVSQTFSELSQATTDTTKSPAAVTTNSLYDVFVWSDGGTIRATRGPAWSSSTSRGTGAGTSELTLTNGIYVNKNSITNGPAAGLGTYVGTIGSNGSSQIDFILGGSASGGTAGSLQVWNNYNRVVVTACSIDNGTSYTYSSATNVIRQARASSGNQISFVCGLAEDSIYAGAFNSLTPAASNFADEYIGLDTTSAGLPGSAVTVGGAGAPSTAGYNFNVSLSLFIGPQLGSHFISRNEQAGSVAATFNANNVSGQLWTAIPM